MALLDTKEILKLNQKIKTFVLVPAGATDTEDANLFVVQPPPAVRPAEHRAPLESMTRLCPTCRNALEYLSFYLETLKTGGKDAIEDLPAACLLHAGAQTLQQGEDADCHLCILIMSNLRTKRLAMESIDQSHIEICWQSDELTPSRIVFALTHNGHERATNNYWNFLKLQLWPCSEFGAELFGRDAVGANLVRHGHTGSEQSRDRALRWLSRCQENADGKHDQCNQPPGDWLPTRLLDVTHALETSTLKLVSPRDNPDEFVSDKRYMTLSHCWGAWGSTELPTLTTENLDKRQTDGLDISLLPKTFREALEVAQWFKVRWLWIDSLCIVQDSTEDWQREAVMMYSVYRNALLNISADDSNDARWGCFRYRDPLSVLPMRLKLPGVDEWAHWLTPDSNGIFEAVSRVPLAKRAWVFQERQLSRRILHFTSRELIWECCAEGSHFACETFPEGAPFKTVFSERQKFQSQSDLNKSNPAALYGTWDTLCQAYSEKLLSHGTDKTVALSGLAQEFQAALPTDTYVAGSWRSTLPQSLLWKSSDDCGHVEANRYIAPSWSWLSVDGPISHFETGSTAHPLVDITRVATEAAIPSQPTASLKSASLHLRCYLRPVEVQPDYEKHPWYMMAIGGGKQHKLIVKDEGKEIKYRLGDFDHTSFGFSFDVPHDEHSGPASVSGYFLPICIKQPTEGSAKVIKGLLVEPVDDDLTTFRRIGVLSFEGPDTIPIGYRLKQNQETGQRDNEASKLAWDALEDLLRPHYESSETLEKEKKREAKRKARAKASSASVSSDGKAQDSATQDAGKAEDEPAASTEADEQQTEATEAAEENLEREATESTATEEKTVEAEEKTSREDSDAADAAQPSVDLASIDALERMYALDSAVVGSELEAQFERLVPREIILI